ncbi:KxYKxGKxW signal peptide domain-containing protein [Pediococcus ethanolidurans]|uniref:KxYKxGKxW signal peptide domain-containing protein n=1 Tax=Pediococcus ethanolidurans TaxID=319653 RepID=UPI00384C908B
MKRLKLLRDSGQPKEHFKMYKVRKTWLFAGITALFFGTAFSLVIRQSMQTLPQGSRQQKFQAVFLQQALKVKSLQAFQSQ